MNRTFTIVGISEYNNRIKFRVGNGSLKAKEYILKRNGDKNIKLIKLDIPVSKIAAIKFFKSLNPDVQKLPIYLRRKKYKSIKEQALNLLDEINYV